MKFESLVNLVGEDWAHVMKKFMCPDEKGFCQFDEIAARLSDGYAKAKVGEGKNIFPLMKDVFNTFKATPFPSVRVIMLGGDPYFLPGLANGIGFATAATEYKDCPKSLQAIYDAIEKDIYNGLDLQKPTRRGFPGKSLGDGKYKNWTDQGILLLNSSLTVEERNPGSHMQLWKPFMDFFLRQLQEYKRNLIYIGWGPHAKDLIQWRRTEDGQVVGGINIFQSFPMLGPHPSEALLKKEVFATDHFSKTNLIIRANNLGAPIEW